MKEENTDQSIELFKWGFKKLKTGSVAEKTGVLLLILNIIPIIALLFTFFIAMFSLAVIFGTGVSTWDFLKTSLSRAAQVYSKQRG